MHKSLYQCTRLSMKMRNSPNSFHCSMTRLFSGLLYQGMVINVNNLVAYGTTFLILVSKKVFQHLDSAKLKLKTSMCHFFYRNIDMLEYNILAKGLEPLKKNIIAIREFPIPLTSKDVRSFFGYCKNFIHRFSDITGPMTDFTKKIILKTNSCTGLQGTYKRSESWQSHLRQNLY